MLALFTLAPGVSIRGIRTETLHALWVAAAFITGEGYEAVCTSGTEGTHGIGSFHYLGLAADMRMRHIPVERRGFIRDKVAAVLGPEFDVIQETTPVVHMHIEFQPKGPLNKLMRNVRKKLRKRHVKKVYRLR